MIRLITLLYRRPDLSTEAFRDYYERHHRVIGERVLSGFACRYIRHHLTATGESGDDGPDVVLEIGFPDQTSLEACLASLAEPSTAEEIATDEARLFDRARTRMFQSDSRESLLPQPGAQPR